jgi:hypothetical protein
MHQQPMLSGRFLHPLQLIELRVKSAMALHGFPVQIAVGSRRMQQRTSFV